MTTADPPAEDAEPRRSRRNRIRAHWPASRRKRVATVLALVAVFIASSIASAHLLRLVFGPLDLIAYAGLFLVCWIGAGGALVPVPGVRPLSWFMIVQQGAALDPVIVALVGAFAMVLGQSSYFVAASRIARRVSSKAPAPGPASPGPDGEGALDAHELELAEQLEVSGADVPAHTSERPWSRRVARARAGVEARVQKHGMATVFLVSALPSPLTTLTTSAAAASGMAYVRFFPASFAGFLVLCSILALFGQGLVAAIRSVVGGA